MNVSPRQRKCRCCSEFFVPDYRNRHHQVYCPKPACQLAGKSASQRRWLSQPANRDYFRGPENVERVKQWRQSHPGYWKKKSARPADIQAPAPQGVVKSSPLVTQSKRPGTLQEVCITAHPAFIGLISMFTGSTLQEDIASTTRKLEARGRDILGLTLPALSSNADDYQTPDST